MQIQSLIRTVPNYPKPGIQFRDITSLLQNAEGLQATIQQLKNAVADHKIDKVAGIDARGFIIGAALAHALGLGFIPIRKKGKLPGKTIAQSYALEYGNDQLEIHTDAIQAGENILLVDDLIATGGTAAAAVQLIQQLEGKVTGAAFVVDLPDLGGMQRLKDLQIPTHALCAFAGE